MPQPRNTVTVSARGQRSHRTYDGLHVYAPPLVPSSSYAEPHPHDELRRARMGREARQPLR